MTVHDNAGKVVYSKETWDKSSKHIQKQSNNSSAKAHDAGLFFKMIGANYKYSNQNGKQNYYTDVEQKAIGSKETQTMYSKPIEASFTVPAKGIYIFNYSSSKSDIYHSVKWSDSPKYVFQNSLWPKSNQMGCFKDLDIVNCNGQVKFEYCVKYGF